MGRIGSKTQQALGTINQGSTREVGPIGETYSEIYGQDWLR